MDAHIIAAAVSSFFAIATAFPYVRDMLKGTTRPNVVTWGLWFLIQAIFAAAQWSVGASWSIALPLTQMLPVGFVVILGLIGYGYKEYTKLDVACLCVALMAIVLWQVTSEPILALLFSVGADFVAAVPTLVKSYKDPYSETPSSYFLVVLSAVFALLSTTIYDLPNLLWPLYIFFINGSIFCLAYVGQGAKRSAVGVLD